VRAHRGLVLLQLLTAACSGGSTTTEDVPVVAITAQQWSFSPNTIPLQRGVAVDLEITSNDVHHGFNLPDLDVRADVVPGKTATVRIKPEKAGTFLFHCDYYCGSGHEGMNGQIIVR
jgi:cytochrome c oxidase subunit 2